MTASFGSPNNADEAVAARESLLRYHILDLNNSAQRVGAILAAGLVPGFSVLDWFVVRNHFGALLLMRLAVAVYALICLALTRTRFGRDHVSQLSTSLVSLTAIAVIVMVYIHKGYRSPYYAGVMLVVVGAGTLYRWNLRERLLTYGIICAAYFVPILFEKIEEPPTLISNAFFLVSTVIIVAAAQGYTVNVARREFFANLDLQTTKSSLETAYERLQELDRLKSQFFSNITHELRTPLTMILAPIEGLIDGEFGNLARHQREYLRPTRQNALKLLKLINDLLDLAKIDEQFLRLRVEQTDLVGLVTEIIEQSQPMAARKDIALTLETIATGDDLFVDVDRLERALVNILSNALKFTAPGGHVKLWMNASDSEVQIGVRDSGIGIATHQLDRIFERFSQADGSVTRQYGGTGIGLSLAREIVELHGGHITVSSREGEGSEFVISLRRGDAHLRPEILDRRQSRRPSSTPRRGEDREPREWTQMLLGRKDYRYLEIAEATERRAATRSGSKSTSNKILVVEDNADVLRFLNMQLSEDHNVYLAANGVKGLELALRELPDIVITDYMMPEMDGLTLLRKLRDDPRTQNIPVIILTAKSQVQDRIDAREAGAEIFLNKPFSPRELRTAINQLLEKRGRQLSYTLHEQVKSLEQISAGLAHEIHNPLNYIRSALFVMKETSSKIRVAADDPQRQLSVLELIRVSQDKIEHMHEIAQKGVDRIARVVDLVRNYAREGYFRKPTAIVVDKLILQMAPLLSPANEFIIHVEFDLHAGEAEVLGIAEDLQQALGNIWQNALDALGPGGHVVICTRLESDWVVIEIADDGPGIPRDQIRKVFTPFFSTKGPGKGLGLGLPIAYQVISQAGGTMTVDSVEQQGTTFTLRIPKYVNNGDIAPQGEEALLHTKQEALERAGCDR